MRELAFLNKGIKISINDLSAKKEKKVDFKFDGGILEFVDFLDKDREKLKNKNDNDLFKKPIFIEGKKDNLEIECSLKWNAGYSEDVYAYTNNISIINAAPYASGVLAKGTERSRLIAYSEATDQELEPVKELEKICRKYNIPLPAAALQFSLNDKRISSTLVGVTKPKRVSDTIELSKFIIPNEAWDEINQLPYTTHDVEAAREYKPG